MRCIQVMQAFVELGGEIGKERFQPCAHSFPARVGQTAIAEIDRPFEGPIPTRIDATPFDGRDERLHPGGPLREPGRGWALWRRWKLHARLHLSLQERLGAL